MKKHIRLFCTMLAAVLIFASVNVSAAQIYKDGSKITFHNASPYYIVDDAWIEGKYSAELSGGTLYVSVEDFKTAFKCNISYNYNDTSISVQFANASLWQALGYGTLFVNGAPYSVPAPYISSAPGNPVMIPLEPYASTIGYKGTWETIASYAAGQMTLELEKVPYTIVGVRVNQAAQLVSIMGKSPSGSVEPVKYMLCSTGTGVRTPNGTYRLSPLGTDWYYFSSFNCFVRYCTQITGNICFHSLTFNGRYVDSLSRTAYNAIGTKASHGCIRLFVDDAKFIHQNCRGLSVTIEPGYTNAETDAIRAQILASKPTYEEYVKSMK